MFPFLIMLLPCWGQGFLCRFHWSIQYENQSVYRGEFLDVWVSNAVWEQPQWHRFFSNTNTKNKNRFYVETFRDFLIASSMFFVFGSDLNLEFFNLCSGFFNVFKIVVHLNVLQKGQSEVFVCWHGLNFKYLFCWSN